MKTTSAVIAKAPGGPAVLEVAEIEPPTAAEGEVEFLLAFAGDAHQLNEEKPS